MMDSKNKVFNIFNAPRGKACAAGEEIYEWEFLDDKGELQKDSKNVKEEINSFISRVDYKAQIKRGEFEVDGSLSSISKDFRGLPDNTVDIYSMFSALASLDKEQVANILEQVNGTNQKSVQTTQTGDKATTSTGQVSSEDVEKQSTSSTISSDTIEGGTK